MIPDRARIDWLGARDSRIDGQGFHRSERLLERPGQAAARNIISPIRFVRAIANGRGPQRFEQDTHLDSRLAAIPGAVRLDKIHQAKGELATRLNALGQLEV